LKKIKNHLTEFHKNENAQYYESQKPLKLLTYLLILESYNQYPHLKYGITGFGLCNSKHLAHIHFISFFFVSSSQKHPFKDLLRWLPNCQTFDGDSTKTNYKWKFKI
jgi:hypothetical protein